MKNFKIKKMLLENEHPLQEMLHLQEYSNEMFLLYLTIASELEESDKNQISISFEDIQERISGITNDTIKSFAKDFSFCFINDVKVRANKLSAKYDKTEEMFLPKKSTNVIEISNDYDGNSIEDAFAFIYINTLFNDLTNEKEVVSINLDSALDLLNEVISSMHHPEVTEAGLTNAFSKIAEKNGNPLKKSKVKRVTIIEIKRPSLKPNKEENKNDKKEILTKNKKQDIKNKPKSGE